MDKQARSRRLRWLTGGAIGAIALGLMVPAAIAAETATISSEVHGPAHGNLTGTDILSAHVVHHHVNLSGAFGVPSGTVDFTRYSGQFCAGAPVATENDVTLVNGEA